MKKINNQWYTDKQYIDLLEDRIISLKSDKENLKEACDDYFNRIINATNILQKLFEKIDDVNLCDDISKILEILNERKWK